MKALRGWVLRLPAEVSSVYRPGESDGQATGNRLIRVPDLGPLSAQVLPSRYVNMNLDGPLTTLFNTTTI